MKKMNPQQIHQAFAGSKIVLCKRNSSGQFYVARGLRNMVHFTIGPEGKTQLTAFLRKNNITFYELKGDDSDPEHPSWFQVLSRSNKNSKECQFLDDIDEQLKSIGKTLIPELLKVSNMSS